jgi:hypothetical protein
VALVPAYSLVAEPRSEETSPGGPTGTHWHSAAGTQKVIKSTKKSQRGKTFI